MVAACNRRKWNYGNYLEITNNDQVTFDELIPRINADINGNYKGIMIRYGWRDIETSEGVYSGIDSILNFINQIKAFNNRKMILFIQFKTFGLTNYAVPDYMISNPIYADPDGYGNGQYEYASANLGSGGFVPNMHVATVRARFNAMMSAISVAFDNNVNFEAIVFSEASIRKPYQVSAAWSRQGEWYDGMLASFRVIKPKFSKTQIFQWINAPRIVMRDWVPKIVNAGISLGIPDNCKNDADLEFDPYNNPGTSPGNFYWMQTYAGQCGIMVHNSRESFDGTVVSRNQGCNCPDLSVCPFPNTKTPYYPGPAQTRQEQQDFAVGTLKANYSIWIHHTGSHSSVNLPTSPVCNPAIYTPIYPGQPYNTVTDEWINNPSSRIKTIETRPIDW